MELAEYIRLARKWAWLLLVFAFVGGGVSFIVNTGKPPVYSASATISIGRYLDAPNPNSTEIQTGISLAQTYVQIIRTHDVLQGTIDALQLDLTPEELDELFTTNVLTGTALLVVTVNYDDPVFAADTANMLAEQLILRSPTNLTTAQQAQVDYASAQIDILDAQMQQQLKSIEQIDAQLAATTDPAEVARLNEIKVTLTEQTTQAAGAIAQFQTTITSIQQRTNALDIVERATIPAEPTGSNLFTNIILGIVVGVFMGGGLVLLIEYLDDRLRSTEIATQILELPVLGAIPRFGKGDTPYGEGLITAIDSLSPIAESYRRLQTNLMFTSNSGKKVFVITSPGPSDGKSITAANLAATIAMDGIPVLLIDGDLRRPRQHEIFGLENQVGLATLLLANQDADSNETAAEAEQEKKDVKQLARCIQSSSIPKLKVITAGFVPSNPTEVLRSTLMKRWLDLFRAARDIDVIIIDTPPALLFGDSTIIATLAEAGVVLVVDSERTRGRAALATKQQLGQVGIDIKGVILNRINPRDETEGYGYGYNYGYGYYYGSDRQNGDGRLMKIRRLLPRRRKSDA